LDGKEQIDCLAGKKRVKKQERRWKNGWVVKYSTTKVMRLGGGARKVLATSRLRHKEKKKAAAEKWWRKKDSTGSSYGQRPNTGSQGLREGEAGGGCGDFKY